MILVDTSVWLRAFYDREPYRAQLDRLLATETVVGHEFVYGELLIGDPGGRHPMLAAYSQSEFTQTVSHVEVLELTRARRLHGRGLSWIDAHLLASALAGRHQLWSADTSLVEVAHELGVAWKPLPANPGVQHR